MDLDDNEVYDWACNRCNLVREQGVGRCPHCRCPEFRLIVATFTPSVATFTQAMLFDC